MGIRGYNFGKKKISYDPDALSFIIAAGLTNPIQKNAIDHLVKQLKSANIWTKFKAIYPLIGGTAFSHKFNLKDPRDLDAAFRLQFNGNFIHDSNGIKGDGVAGTYANTFLIPNNSLITDNVHLSSYIKTDNAVAATDIGVVVEPGSNSLSLMAKWGANTYMDCYSYTNNNRITVAQSSSLGLFILNRSSHTTYNAWKNGTKIGNNNNVAVIPNLTIPLWISGSNSTGAKNYSDRNYAFFSIGDSFTDSDALNFYNIVQLYQTSLGRQV